MKIERIKLKDIKPYANNAKIHTPEQIEQIKSSIQQFGNNDPIAIDENNVIIEGHGRLIALQQLGYTDAECIRLTHLTDEQKRAYILVHNKLTMNTGFDMDILESELKGIHDIDMGSFDFDMDIAIDGDMTFDEADDEPLPEPPAEPTAKRGQVYKLGEHRLMCGDSTSEQDVNTLTEGAEMDLCVTDPPYNVNYGDKAEMLGEYDKGHRNTNHILNDNMDDHSFYLFLRDFYIQMLRVLKFGGGYYIFHSDTEGLNFRAALREAGGLVKQTVIWVKNSLVLGRQDYQWKHEPCLYGWKEGAGHYFVDDRCQTTVFEARPDIDNMSADELKQTARILIEKLENIHTTILHENKPAVNDLHPTMKPIPLVAKLIQNSSRKGEKVIDFFGGSGTTLMACEETGRRAYLMELDPGYVDVIIKRWEESTGRKAELINGNR